MSAPVRPNQHDDGAARAADLSELLGHLNACWDDERRALARQLHDSLGSSLTALSLHLGMLTQKLPPEPALLDRAAQMKQLLHTIIDTNRAMQHKLWNDKLEFLGMRAALSELVAQFGAQHALQARCRLPEDEPRCPRSHQVALLRALEEGLRNVAAHARATEVEVTVDDNDEAITLTVRDNGVGLQAPALETAGKHGLRTVRERLACLGGSLTVHANPERGVTLTAVLPKAPAHERGPAPQA